ncbi:DNA-protecting protein DprA [Bacillus sp. UMB0899]|uniref:DNA-processing protein DprA n=1 Tax=Metabacillus schmidteae TaxID=2730405 RepID=UPI000C7F81DD|nr:DNA-processing protein DprA [Metabacillus schmidteae]PMC38424.1 DNA-protecting protein DprA [Bacillus sp. UMB0899]
MNKRLFLLAHCKGVSQQILRKMMKVDPTLELFFHLKDHEWEAYFQLNKERIKAIKEEYHSMSFIELEKQYKKDNIMFLSLYDQAYPPLLKEISDPPPFLFYKGDIALSHSAQIISVVGTRNPNHYGKSALNFIIKPLIVNNWVIVSGLANGIDAMAHTLSINQKGKTIAVIAGGFYHLYPKQNQTLAEQIMTSHLILSEHAPSTPPQRWHFPMRNRIISGLSKGTIIIQAQKRSGSLITAQQALDQNREVFAVPGSIFDEYSGGTNDLIQNGAKLVQDVSHIIEEFPR